MQHNCSSKLEEQEYLGLIENAHVADAIFEA
jgi:hypothetical protein